MFKWKIFNWKYERGFICDLNIWVRSNSAGRTFHLVWAADGWWRLEQSLQNRAVALFAVWTGDRGTYGFWRNICISQSALGKQWSGREKAKLISNWIRGEKWEEEINTYVTLNPPSAFFCANHPGFEYQECECSASELFYTGSVPAVQCGQLHFQLVSKNVQMESWWGVLSM